MLSLIAVSATCSALVAAAMTFWLLSRRRTVQVQQLDIVDSDRLSATELLAANYGHLKRR